MAELKFHMMRSQGSTVTLLLLQHSYWSKSLKDKHSRGWTKFIRLYSYTTTRSFLLLMCHRLTVMMSPQAQSDEVGDAV